MGYRDRFEALVDELRRAPGVTVEAAYLGPPTDPASLARARAVAGAAWPEGMTELYTALASVDIRYQLAGFRGGAIQIPPVEQVWDYAGLEDDLWFDWLVDENPDHPFAQMRPIDRFVEEACAVLYPVPPPSRGTARDPAMVHLHTSGESLFPTGLDFATWLELLFRSRGAYAWLGLTLGRPTRRTWVEENIDAVAALFPSFDPPSLCPRVPRAPVPID
jgi:hypothetical protein